MTATDELRKLLDERGVEWTAGEDEYDRKTHWESGGLTWEYFNNDNGDAWLGFLGVCESDVSPEQAIAATLGAGTCEVKAIEKLGDMLYGIHLSCNHSMVNPFNDSPYYCPWCGAKVVNE